ncbi:MAG: hypothetical protein ACHQFW_09920 [Chitinophagales bacterium]
MPTVTLPLTATSVVLFENVAGNIKDIKITVDGQLLGYINHNYPVTIFVTNNSGSKTITWKDITDTEYTSGNRSIFGQDTFITDVLDADQNFSFGNCNTGDNYKIIGWDDEICGQSCVGSGGWNQYFGINASLELKCKTEEFTYNGVNKWRAVMRYDRNVMRNEAESSAQCYSGGPYCYACVV